MSMQQLGAKVGTKMASGGKIWLMAFVSFIIGILVTISEPDLVILSEQVSSVKPLLLILTVSIGVGIFLMIAVLRIVFKINLSIILAVFYAVAFALSFFPSGEGKRPDAAITLDNERILLSSMRKTDEGYQVTLYNTTIKPETTHVSIPMLGYECDLEFGRYELKIIDI